MQVQPLINKVSIGIYHLSERAVTLQFGNEISLNLLSRINSFNQLLQQHPFPGLQTTVPAYATLSVFYDALIVAKGDLPGKSVFDKVSGYLHNLQEQRSDTQSDVTGHTITIPVYYGGEYGPDIDDVAEHNNLTVDQVIDLHSSTTYTVHMIGFVPGFAYMGGMDPKLATPRRQTPRQAIEAGSVGIAGGQTGVYPLQTPGGWQIIGRTPLAMFDAKRTTPALLSAGDKITFKPITLKEFSNYVA